MVRREAYERVGTHAAVRHEVAEDLALAQAFFRAGLRSYFAFAESLMETRMYESLPHLVEGWSKNIYLGGRRSFPDRVRATSQRAGEPVRVAYEPEPFRRHETSTENRRKPVRSYSATAATLSSSV